MGRDKPMRPPLRPRALGLLLQSPAHCVLQVLRVTQAHWQLQHHRLRIAH